MRFAYKMLRCFFVSIILIGMGQCGAGLPSKEDFALDFAIFCQRIADLKNVLVEIQRIDGGSSHKASWGQSERARLWLRQSLEMIRVARAERKRFAEWGNDPVRAAACVACLNDIKLLEDAEYQDLFKKYVSFVNKVEHVATQCILTPAYPVFAPPLTERHIDVWIGIRDAIKEDPLERAFVHFLEEIARLRRYTARNTRCSQEEASAEDAVGGVVAGGCGARRFQDVAALSKPMKCLRKKWDSALEKHGPIWKLREQMAADHAPQEQRNVVVILTASRRPLKDTKKRERQTVHIPDDPALKKCQVVAILGGDRENQVPAPRRKRWI